MEDRCCHSRLITILGILTAVASFSSSFLLGEPKNGDTAAFRDGVILIGFRDLVSEAQRNNLLRLIGAAELKRIGVGTHVVHVPNGLVQPLIQFLKTRPEIRYAEPDFVHTLSAGAIPNDTSVGLQWAVQNTGQTANGASGTPGADERTPAPWSMTTGTNAVVVAIVDSGVQYTHPDLFTNMWNNPGGIGGCPAGSHGYNVLSVNCDPMDDDNAYGGHGSHVAGILGAAGNNAAGVAGVNWTTSIMAVKWVTFSAGGVTSDLITALDWVIASKKAGVNVRVVNDSATWPGTGFSQALSDEIDLLGSNDILFVTAAGNTAENNDSVPRYPCSYNRPNMICVAATDQNDNLWGSSNFGTTTVQLGAPGVNIYSTKRLSNYGYISGTSMASPQVAGTAALILSLGYRTVSDLRTMILNSIDKLPSLGAFVATGGRLNVCKAVPGCSTASPAAPAIVSSPVVAGLPQAGSVIAASTGIWSGLPTAYTYQWSRCTSLGTNCAPIANAIGSMYALLAPADAGATFSVRVTGTNVMGSTAAFSAPSAPVAPAASPFTVGSTITDGQTVAGSVLWQATPVLPVNYVEFYIDGVLQQTIVASPYVYNQSGSGKLDTTTLTNGSHTLGIRTLSADYRTFGFYGASVTVANSSSSVRLVQSNASEGSGVGSVAATFASSNTAGNLIIAFVRMSTASQTVRLSDSAGNVYTDAISQAQTGDGHQIHIFYAKNVKGGVNTVTAAFSATNNHPWLAIYEYSGLNQTTPLDQTAAAQGSSSTVDTGPATATSGANELVFAAAGFQNNYGGTVSATGAYALQQQDTSTSRAVNETLVTTSTGSFSGTFNLSSSTQWSAVIATFLPIGVTVTPPSITTASLPNGTQNASYTATLTATGGMAPYTWSINSGSLPAGLALASNSGVISGTPTAAGTIAFTVTVSDRNSLTATQPLSITIGPGVSKPIVLVQSTAIEGSHLTAMPVAFPSNNTAGNLIVAAVRMSTTSQTVSVTDSAGNVYVEAVSQGQTADGHQIHLFYATNVKGGANTVTARFSGSNNHPWLGVFEYNGLNQSNPLDQTARAQGFGSNPTTGATASTNSANELVFAFAGFPASFGGGTAAGSGFTLLQQDTGTSRSATEAQLVTSAGSYTGAFTLTFSTSWSAVEATFKQ